jgi:hypothetical protein
MKMKYVSILTTVVVASLGVTSAHGIQQPDSNSQSAYSTAGTIDPDLARQVRYQSGSPRRKADLYVAAPSPVPDPNLVRQVRYQNGSPRRKPDLYVAVSGPATDRDLLREMRDQNGSPRSKK